jgi:hypothetical protein
MAEVRAGLSSATGSSSNPVAAEPPQRGRPRAASAAISLADLAGAALVSLGLSLSPQSEDLVVILALADELLAVGLSSSASAAESAMQALALLQVGPLMQARTKPLMQARTKPLPLMQARTKRAMQALALLQVLRSLLAFAKSAKVPNTDA